MRSKCVNVLTGICFVIPTIFISSCEEPFAPEKVEQGYRINFKHSKKIIETLHMQALDTSDSIFNNYNVIGYFGDSVIYYVHNTGFIVSKTEWDGNVLCATMEMRTASRDKHTIKLAEYDRDLNTFEVIDPEEGALQSNYYSAITEEKISTLLPGYQHPNNGILIFINTKRT